MEKIFIFGTGKLLNKYIDKIDLNCVLAFIDNSKELQDTTVFDKLIINPEKIKEYEYDYIVIFNKFKFDEIYYQLIDRLHVEKEKILSWMHYIYIMKHKVSYLSTGIIDNLNTLIKKLEIKKILDIDMGLIRLNLGVKGNQNELPLELLHIDNYGLTNSNCIMYSPDFYKKYIDSIELLHNHYDAVFLLDMFMNNSISDVESIIEETYEKSKYIILTIPNAYPDKFTEWNNFDFYKYGKIRIISLELTRIVLIEKEPTLLKKDVKIFIVTHKSFIAPKEKMYIPIYAGRCNDNEMDIIGDATGQNISSLNLIINECTALYWMWKNVKCDYIGLNHYRRYFLNNNLWYDKDNLINQESIVKYMDEYDIITVNAALTYPYTVKEQLKMSICADAFRYGYYSVRNIIKKRHSEYLKIFDDYFNGYLLFPCNMFITSKEIMNTYCEWLFDIIIEVAENADVTKYDNYSKRIVGFMAERLLTIWIMKNGLKIKELPLLLTDD